MTECEAGACGMTNPLDLHRASFHARFTCATCQTEYQSEFSLVSQGSLLGSILSVSKHAIEDGWTRVYESDHSRLTLYCPGCSVEWAAVRAAGFEKRSDYYAWTDLEAIRRKSP